MLTLLPTVRVFLAAGATDLRKSFDTLAEVATRIVGQDPLSGHLFVFCNKGRNRLKVLWWDGSGYWLLHRRLERGTFAWPRPVEQGQRSIEMTTRDLSLLVAGVDLAHSRMRRWYSRTPTALNSPAQ